MKLYRLTQKRYQDEPFNPIGAKLFGGRWNSKGVEALYFAQSESLCALEVFVHVNKDPAIADQYDLYRIELPEELVIALDEDELPPGWRDVPPSELTQEIGDQFLKELADEYAALQVPSAISPRDCNFVLNPANPKLERVLDRAEKLDFRFDMRIFS